ncbi:cytidylyltransferase [Aspergillus ellipticus CBS 707.79]|uniref:Cytidylyltransferase n=1 Tax=Aspergillus ellipticus CBS 707.79 TaxID=1448320 RepID=A0A319D8V7_9EURO|nr:cytidylyltransferase [Aspergillus ellipticus CBS 707.79]
MTSPAFLSLREKYASGLKRFIASSRNLDVLASVPSDRREPAPTTDVLYVLDSSFNPPTLAHNRIATSAVLEDPTRPARLLLLLATQNADKPSKPASFEDRLVMMEMFARDFLSSLGTNVPTLDPQNLPVIDIGVTKKPYFVDKAAEIERAGVYPKSLEQVHLTGYDTLIRIFNPKYYPPEHTLQPLGPFLSQHRLRVTMRPDSDWGTRDEQEAFLQDLARGGKDSVGGKREWAQRIKLVEGKKPGAPSVSSTRAREAAATKPEDLEWLVPPSVREVILAEQPYTE